MTTEPGPAPVVVTEMVTFMRTSTYERPGGLPSVEGKVLVNGVPLQVRAAPWVIPLAELVMGLLLRAHGGAWVVPGKEPPRAN